MQADASSSAGTTRGTRHRGLAEWATRYRLATVLAAISAAVFAVGAVLLFVNREVPTPEVWGFRGFTGLLVVPYGAVGWLVATRRPANPIGWIFLGMLFGGALMLTTYEYALARDIAGRDVPLGELAAWVQGWLWLVTAIGGSLLLFLLFPDGRLPSPRWRVVLVVGLVAIAVAVVVIGLAPVQQTSPGFFPSLYPFGNPYGVQGADWLLAAIVVAVAVSNLCLVAAALGRVWRLRVASGVERRQLAWITYASAFVPITAVAGTIAYPNELLEALNIASFGVIAVAAGVAILRYRLYDIDIIVNRTLVYVPLTAIVAGLYSASVALFQRLFVAVTGETSDAAIVVSTLILAASFTSLKNWLQARVDKRFKEALDAGPALTKLIDEVEASVYRPDPERFARRFLRTAVDATGSRAGEITLRDGRRTISVTTPDWTDGMTAELVARIRRNGTDVGRLALAGRTGGRPYSASEMSAVEGAVARLTTVLQ